MQTKYQTISRALSGRMLYYAFALLRPWVQDSPSLSDRLLSLEEAYSRMADDYLLRGSSADVEEELRRLVSRAYVLLDEAYVSALQKGSTAYEVKQMLLPATAELSPYVASTDSLEGPLQVFRFFWLRTDIAEWEYEQLLRYTRDENMEVEALMGVAGLTLSLLRVFNEQGLLTLLEAASPAHIQGVRERAWVGAILVLMHYDCRLPFFPHILERVQQLLEDEDGQTWAFTALTGLVRTLATDWVGECYESFQSQITPMVERLVELVKRDGKSEAYLSMHSDELPDDLQTEFGSIIEEQKRQMSALHEKQLDVSFALFSGMYHQPFFQQIEHWLLPYDEDYLPEEARLRVPRVNQWDVYHRLCDSDRFALLCMVSDMPVDGDVPEDELFSGESSEEGEGEVLCAGYIRQLFRFFRLNPWAIETGFSHLENLSQWQITHLICPSSKMHLMLADELRACHAYSQADELYRSYAHAVPSASVYRHAGYNAQQLEQFADALNWYRQAVELQPDEWTYRQMAYCLDKQERYDDQLAVLDTLLSAHPDNANYLFEKAKCLEKLDLSAEALPLYYHLLVLKPDNASVMRSFAWCAMVCGERAEARKYYERLMPEATMADAINFGHLCFIEGRREEALDCYSRALDMAPSLRAFLTAYRPDRHFLLEQGLGKWDLYRMEDLIIHSAHLRH